MSPKFSIVLPTVGRGPLAREALNSALNQQGRFDPYEIVVLDNCSADGTWDYVQSLDDPRIKAFRNSHRLTTAQNWNKAVRLSKGEFVFMLHDDNVVLPNMMARLSRATADHADVDLVCFVARYLAGDEPRRAGGWLPEHEELLPAPEGLMRFARGWTTPTCSFMVFARAVYERYGGFEEESADYPVFLDIEFTLRWLVHCDTLFVPDSLAMHRLDELDGITATTQLRPEMFTAMAHAVNRIFRSAVDSGRLDSIQVRALREALVETFLLDLFRHWEGSQQEPKSVRMERQIEELSAERDRLLAERQRPLTDRRTSLRTWLWDASSRVRRWS